jgi:chemotaxis protein histidine kinase CheA
MEDVQDDMDTELLPLFLEEAADLYPRIGLALQDWSAHPDDESMQRRLQRNLHTFKGSARMAGAMRLGELSHRMEERMAGAERQSSFWAHMQSDLGRLGDLINQLHDDWGDGAPPAAAEESAEQTALMLPFARISKRLYRVARETGKELNKKVNLELHGTEVSIERRTLERMTGPFEHLLRNSIAHGLESPEERERVGKSPIGDICLSLRREKKEIVFNFSDDGAGLNIDTLSRRAREKGLLQSDAPASDDQIMQLIFAPGLSTATSVTEISGRGVGMDVVRSEVAELGGRIAVSSEQGKGVEFVIRLPSLLDMP